MKINPEFIAREIAGELVIVPVGEAAKSNDQLISANEVGAFIWNALAAGKSLDETVAAILEEFEIDGQTARADAEQFICELKEIGAIIE